MASRNTKYNISNENEGSFKLNPLTLHFNDSLEPTFREYYFESAIKIVRIAIISGILYYATFFILDLLTLRDSISVLAFIRFGIVCPLATIGFILSYTKNFKKYYQFAIFILVIISGLGIVAMTVIVPMIGRYDYYVGIILVLIYCYLLTRLRITYASGAGWIITLAYIASIHFFPGIERTSAIVNIFFVVTTNILGMFGSVITEYFIRRNFYFQGLLIDEKQKVAEANSELEAKVNEKTAELQTELEEKNEVAEELLASKEKAEESDRLKTAFLTNMSHEIRTPMNGILGFSNLLKSRDINPDKQKIYIEMIEKSGDRMLNTLNDLINISKIEAGLMTLVDDVEDISKILADLYSFFEYEALNKGLSFNYKPAIKDESLIINTDKEKFTSIISNLLKNSIKFTDDGFIEFGYLFREELTEPELEFYVIDSGKGIPKERQHNIFDRFIQADSDYNRASEGFGLGLSIAKAYTEMLGGRIWLNTNHSNGAEFRFTIPIKAAKIDEYEKLDY